jgi:hypothetical protein
VLPGVPPTRRIRSWKTWEEGTVPSFALEVVSRDVDKDYIDAPALHRELGTQELVIFDPHVNEAADRVRFQLYRRTAKRGFVAATVTNEDRVRSRVLGCWLRVIGEAERLRLRLTTGPSGDVIFPTEAEHERAEKERERAEKERERAEKERERAEKERERAEKEREQAARVAAEAELERVRAELDRLRRRKRKR